MPRSVIVIGSGVAGTAAAWGARGRGSKVVLVSAGAGASAFAGGAVDDVPWEQRTRAAHALGLEAHATAAKLPGALLEFVGALGVWDVPAARGCYLATMAGRVRPARGRDRALLDLEALGRGGRVLLPRVSRPGWDADALARALGDDPFAKALKLQFEAVDAPVLRFDEERRVTDADLAARHDDPARLAWLGESLRSAVAEGTGVAAVLLGPWLGLGLGRADKLAALVGLPVGEALIGAGSPAGLRFEVARDALFKAGGIEVISRRVRAVGVAGGDASGGTARFAVSLEEKDASLRADAVVLATGGVSGGGVIYTPAEHGAGADLPSGGRVPFALSLTAPVRLGDGRGALEATSSLFGPALDTVAWPTGSRQSLLEAVGVQCTGIRAAHGLFAAGDAIAARPRTVLEAAATGWHAGVEAASTG